MCARALAMRGRSAAASRAARARAGASAPARSGWLTIMLLRARRTSRSGRPSPRARERASSQHSGARRTSRRRSTGALAGAREVRPRGRSEPGNAQLMAADAGAASAQRSRMPARDRPASADGRARRPVLGVDAILENRVLFGSVNAQRRDWPAAVARSRPSARALARSAGALRHSSASPLDRFQEAFEHRGGKATLVL